MEQDFADQYARYEEGQFRQSAQAFIGSSWQGAALQVGLPGLGPPHAQGSMLLPDARASACRCLRDWAHNCVWHMAVVIAM